MYTLETLRYTVPKQTPVLIYTAIWRKIVGENVHATIPKGNMGCDQYTLPDTVAVEPTFAAFLGTRKHISMASRAIILYFFEQQ